MSLLPRSMLFSRWSNPVAALLLMGASSSLSNAAHADPADFQAMPGLWKITLHTLKNGKDQVVWKCLYDGGDPWTTFVEPMAPAADCERSGEHRGSTSLAWNLACGTAHGQGHIALDSAKHYRGGVMLDGKPVLDVQAQRLAACTSPSD